MPPIKAETFRVNERDRAWVDRQCTPHPIACITEKLAFTGAYRGVRRSVYIRAAEYPSPAFEPDLRARQGRCRLERAPRCRAGTTSWSTCPTRSPNCLRPPPESRLRRGRAGSPWRRRRGSSAGSQSLPMKRRPVTPSDWRDISHWIGAAITLRLDQRGAVGRDLDRNHARVGGAAGDEHVDGDAGALEIARPDQRRRLEPGLGLAHRAKPGSPPWCDSWW